MCVLRKERGVLGRGLVAAAGVSVCSGGSIHSCCNGELLFLSLVCVFVCACGICWHLCVCIYIYIYVCMCVCASVCGACLCKCVCCLKRGVFWGEECCL